MDNPFDEIAKRAFPSILAVYGEGAIWHKSKRTTVPGKVLFKDPTEPINVGGNEQYEYRPANATAEYYAGTFDGLKKSVDGGKHEIISVRDQQYSVLEITTKSDGKIFIAHLEPFSK